MARSAQSMIEKLGKLELDILWMKEQLLRKTKANKAELKAIREAREDIAKGDWISGDDFIRQLTG